MSAFPASEAFLLPGFVHSAGIPMTVVREEGGGDGAASVQ